MRHAIHFIHSRSGWSTRVVSPGLIPANTCGWVATTTFRRLWCVAAASTCACSKFSHLQLHLISVLLVESSGNSRQVLLATSLSRSSPVNLWEIIHVCLRQLVLGPLQLFSSCLYPGVYFFFSFVFTISTFISLFIRLVSVPLVPPSFRPPPLFFSSVFFCFPCVSSWVPSLRHLRPDRPNRTDPSRLLIATHQPKTTTTTTKGGQGEQRQTKKAKGSFIT